MPNAKQTRSQRHLCQLQTRYTKQMMRALSAIDISHLAQVAVFSSIVGRPALLKPNVSAAQESCVTLAEGAESKLKETGDDNVAGLAELRKENEPVNSDPIRAIPSFF
ncbi:hypothetical protein ABUK73_21115 [Agrobacterium sp. BA1120]|uniref:hypothetical protein n=1 Tax=Agrobacterium sp. BA1120 TaxID=3228927 RepID=UPI00336A7311